LARIRDAGATPERGFAGSTQIVAAYRKHLTELAKVEAREMVRVMRSLTQLDLEEFLEKISDPLGDLVAALHRKALVQAISETTANGSRALRASGMVDP